MHLIALIIKGIVLGFAVAAPVGPVGVICLNRSLEKGRIVGFISGLGAASADFCYAVIAAFGLTSISRILIHYIVPLRIIGGIILIYIAAGLFMTHTKAKAEDPAKDKTLPEYYFSTFLITLTNPASLFAFLILFANFATPALHHFYLNAVVLVLAVFVGSALWWLTITWVSQKIKDHLTEGVIESINKTAALLIALLGLVAIVGLHF